MCSWTATAVIDHFIRKGRPVYSCAMDLSKAFDMVDWRELFINLKNKQVDPIFLRVLVFIYRHQQCDVKWGSSYSYRFPVCNGVRQGAVSSPLLFSVYIDGLIVNLRDSGLGCYSGTQFYGCIGYANDLLLACKRLLRFVKDLLSKRILSLVLTLMPASLRLNVLSFQRR